MTHRGCQLCAVPRLNLQWQAVFWWVCPREKAAAFAETQAENYGCLLASAFV